MKLVFNILFIVFFSQNLFAKEYKSEYLIKAKGVTIGWASLDFTLNDNYYEFVIKLKNKGFFSKLYFFKGDYNSKGIVVKKTLIPSVYNQTWSTKKKNRSVKIIFKNKKILNLFVDPVEKELARIDYKKLENYVDPLTSFLNLILYNKPSRTVDGRRAYLMYPETKKDYKKVTIRDFKNIWADHKRNDLKYLEFFQKQGVILPTKINIMFKGTSFSLIKT